MQPAAGDGGSSTKVVLPERKSSRPPETAVPVLKLYYRRAKIQPAAGGGSSTKVVLPEKENPAGRRRRRFQYQSCTAGERKSSRPPETVVPVLKLYYQRAQVTEFFEPPFFFVQAWIRLNEICHKFEDHSEDS